MERRYGTDVGRQCSGEAIGSYSEIEAKRILKHFGLPQNGGIPVLMQALRFRMYHLINKQDFVEVSATRCIFRMRECRVQAMRKKKGLPDYPCKTTGIEEYSHFATAVDPRIKTRSVACPPDAHPVEFWCAPRRSPWKNRVEWSGAKARAGGQGICTAAICEDVSRSSARQRAKGKGCSRSHGFHPVAKGHGALRVTEMALRESL